MRTYEYAFRFTKAKEGGWIINCRDIPEAISQAEANEDRVSVASGCLQAALEGYMRQNRDLPMASAAKARETVISAPVEVIAKAALYEAMKQAKMSKSDLARRLGVNEKEVRRLLDPGYGSKLPRIAQAIEILGKRLVIGLEAA